MGTLTRKPKQFSLEQKRAFAQSADPHQWLLTAISLHEQGIALWRNRGRSTLTMKRENGEEITWDATNRACFLLSAFAMENMLKAFLVYEFPGTVDNGYLKDITTHDLWKLAEKSSLVPYKVRDRWVFDALSDGNESWARYPCGRDAEDINLEGHFTPHLWVKYCDMMQAYHVKMRKLLEKGWQGPHGNHGRWSFD